MTHPCLILVPGLMCDASSWAPMLSYLDGHASYTVVDHGQADSFEKMAYQILATAPPQFHLAGHSMGGRVALQVVRLAPERVQGLALLGTGHRPKEAGEAGEKEVQARQTLLDVARQQGIRAMALNWVQNMVAPSRLKDAAFIEDIVQMFERKSEAIFKCQIHALLTRPDATQVLQQVRVPTLVMAGEFDGWAPPSQHQAMADLIPAHPLIDVITGSGHMMMMEAPEAVAECFVRWLKA
ncbi:alpha/beta hydrolase [Limnohabitans sp. Rim8]|uniref:alpha/beta fold hydrolase n=1 Tax=Limnohabitans sp. Rim8 TaxID=1100718 RepID=UPI00330572BA